jgi:hypothetical protein
MSREQFIDLTAQFRAAAEHSFGAPCKLEIHAMDAVKIVLPFMHDDGIERRVAEHNNDHTFFRTDDPSKLSREAWGKAAYVEVFVTPAEGVPAPVGAWGHAEFKGCWPQQAAFDLEPVDGDAVTEMIGQNSGKMIGDGRTSNTDITATSVRGFSI